MSAVRPVHPKDRCRDAMVLLAMRLEGIVKEPLTFRERRALRRARFDPEAFDLDTSDRTVFIAGLIVLGLLVGGLWLLGR